MRIDNFALTAYQKCPSYYALRIVKGWVPLRRRAATSFGGIVHYGMAEWYRTGLKEKVMAIIEAKWPNGDMPTEDYRTKTKCKEVMSDYIREYPTESFKIVGAPDYPMIEQSFTLKTGMFLDCEHCGHHSVPFVCNGLCFACSAPVEEIEYGGIFDGLVEFYGTIYVLEHKTTSQLGSNYFDQFKPNNQVSGYVWAGGLLSGRPVGGTLVNAIGVYKASATKFERQITNRSEDNIREWLVNLRHWCQRIRNDERSGFWGLNTHACTMYGKCDFHSVHVLTTESERERRLEQDFKREVWDYEDRDD